jgi:hypothetical protein
VHDIEQIQIGVSRILARLELAEDAMEECVSAGEERAPRFLDLDRTSVRRENRAVVDPFGLDRARHRGR